MSNVDEDYYYPASSTILTSRFGYASAKLIHSVEKNLYVVLTVIVSIAALSILNTFGILNYLHPGNVDYFVDLALSIKCGFVCIFTSIGGKVQIVKYCPNSYLVSLTYR